MNCDTALGREAAIESIGNVNTLSASSSIGFGVTCGPVSVKAILAPMLVKTRYTLAAKWATKNKQARVRTLVDIASPLVCLTP
jgi:hypothetical protein